jgi:ribosomal protein L40E
VTFTLARGSTETVFLAWVPTSPGPATIRILVEADGGVWPLIYRNWDFHIADDAIPTPIPDNWADVDFDVQTQPELTIAQWGATPSPFRSQSFGLNLTVTNTGQTPAPDIAVKVWESTAPGSILGSLYGVDVPALSSVNVTVGVAGFSVLDDYVLVAKVDANNSILEPNELNNEVQITVTILAPEGRVIPQSPPVGQVFQPGVRPSVTGSVIATDGQGIPGVDLEVRLLNGAGATVASATGTTGNEGRYQIALNLSTDLPNGAYTIVVDAPTNAAIEPASIAVRIEKQVGFWDTTFAGIPVWVWLIVIVGIAIAAGGGTAYVKFVGLGKLVECGECGAYITEDSTKCPKCGVEFEKDMAKCSNCQAWIPVDVKQCPECGVEFMTGEVEMADYEAQMRKQYDEVKKKFREEASKELGRAMTDREFEDWWRTQPTFVTFEDWLREEEEMRRMGSKPCPVCSTLNSVTATVCHKCGTLLKEEARKSSRPAPAPARPAAAQPPTGMAPEGEEAAGFAPPGEAIPKKVLKKPVVGVPIVQKKVIKRPLEEEKKEGEGTGGEEEQI